MDFLTHSLLLRVALLAEGVDRNCLMIASTRRSTVVALLAEGVDRNPPQLRSAAQPLVALLAEGVDRNSSSSAWRFMRCWSPSSRRAWIEIAPSGLRSVPTAGRPLAEGVDRNTMLRRCSRGRERVALLAEGVDRNPVLAHQLPLHMRSPSSRRAWIEIQVKCVIVYPGFRRPPRGGRG